MIMFFRKLSESWIAKGLMILITISMMTVFGMGGLTQLWGKEDTVIQVGRDKVNANQLMKAFDQELKRTRDMMPTVYLSPQDAIKAGLLNAVIQQTTGGILKANMADDLETIASDDAVRMYIVNNPNFQTITGSFDRNLFSAYLQQMRMSEAEFSRKLRQELAQRQVFDAISAVVAAPSSLVEKMYIYENEARDMDVLLVHTNAVPVTAEPSEQDIEEYYAAMEETLYSPEYRSVTILKMTPEAVAQGIQVSAEELAALYEERKEDFVQPEERKVDQILLSDAGAAEALMKDLTPANFVQMAQEKAGQTEADTNWGWIKKSDVLTEVADAVFDAPEGKVIGPVESSAGYHILVVREIKQAQQTPEAAIKEELTKQVKAGKAYEMMYQKSKEVDNMLGAGESLEKAADSVALALQDIPFVDPAGMTKEGKKVDELPSEALEYIFTLPAGESSPLIDYQNGFLVVRTNEIEPTALKPLADVKEIVIAEWKKDQQKKDIAAFADKIYKAAQKGDDLKTVGLFYHVDEKLLKDMTRSKVQDLPQEVVEQLFMAKKDAVVLVPIGEDFVVAKVTGIEMPDLQKDKVGLMNVQMSLNNRISDGMTEELLTNYAGKGGIQINMPLIEETFSVYMKEE